MRFLPALESALGVSPSEAANWRADVKRFGSVTEAVSAEAKTKFPLLLSADTRTPFRSGFFNSLSQKQTLSKLTGPGFGPP